jgi:membrane protein DedA with SNARE-associated domain
MVGEFGPVAVTLRVQSKPPVGPWGETAMELAEVAATGHHYAWILEAVRTYGYVALFGIIAVQDLGIPTLIPGCVVLMFAGYLASIGVLNPVVAGLVGATSSLGGACALFGASRVLGDTVLRPVRTFIGLDADRHRRIEQFLRRWGLLAWLVVHFVPGPRAALSVVTGLGGMSYRRFASLTAFAALIWAYAFVLLGYFLGRGWRHGAGAAEASGLVALSIVVLVAGVMIWRRKAQTRSQHRSQRPIPSDVSTM